MEPTGLLLGLVVLTSHLLLTTARPQQSAIKGRRIDADEPSQQLVSRGRTIYGEPMRDVPGAEKNFTGLRVSLKSKQLIYYHEQVIAVVELAEQRRLLNCELLEVKTEKDRKQALNSIKTIQMRVRISFKNMMDLMTQCQRLDTPQNAVSNSITNTPAPTQDVTTIFQGIAPGTKWCGRGDLATNYFDLGQESMADRCCRTHDLCPVKISGMATQYNLTNYGVVTRSHCACDTMFFKCLKDVKSPFTDVIGQLYFNVGSSKCVDDRPAVSLNEKNGPKYFRPVNLRY